MGKGSLHPLTDRVSRTVLPCSQLNYLFLDTLIQKRVFQIIKITNFRGELTAKMEALVTKWFIHRGGAQMPHNNGDPKQTAGYVFTHHEGTMSWHSYKPPPPSLPVKRSTKHRASRQGSHSVLLFSKLNKIFFGYFDPENILFQIIKINNFRGDFSSADISAKKEALKPFGRIDCCQTLATNITLLLSSRVALKLLGLS